MWNTTYVACYKSLKNCYASLKKNIHSIFPLFMYLVHCTFSATWRYIFYIFSPELSNSGRRANQQSYWHHFPIFPFLWFQHFINRIVHTWFTPAQGECGWGCIRSLQTHIYHVSAMDSSARKVSLITCWAWSVRVRHWFSSYILKSSLASPEVHTRKQTLFATCPEGGQVTKILPDFLWGWIHTVCNSS